MCENSEREALLKKLSILDFIAVDLHLFLEADSLRYEFEEMYGPLCSFRSMSPDCEFKWINCPWPWKRDFNFNVKECY